MSEEEFVLWVNFGIMARDFSCVVRLCSRRNDVHYGMLLWCGQSVLCGEGSHDVARICVLWARLHGLASVSVT